MPQMSPLWWEILFFMFITCFMIMNTIIYYNKTQTPETKNISKNNINQMSWKW